MAASAVAAFALYVRDRRKLADPATAVARLASPIDRPAAARAVRALSLLGPDGDVRYGDTSRDLALLHVERVLASLPIDRIAERAERLALYLGWGAFAVGLAAAAVVFQGGWSVLEGADVLAAHKNVAPVSMKWLEDVDVVARPPDYVRQDPIHEVDLGPLLLPYGSVLTLHGAPVRPGRALRLSDATTEVPFVDDGSGGLVARWNLTSSCQLRVVARFGEVAIPEAQALSVTSIPDRAPNVLLDDAPRTVKLADETEDIALRYDATDDHGLREVDLVLRAGLTEDRRVLARLDGEAHTEGGHTLRLRDEFLRKSHVPIEVTIEAKDNDPLSGPKWGVSAAITVLPPAVGEPEAQRLDALRGLREAVVDSLAYRLDSPLPADALGRKAFAAADVARADKDEQLLWSATSGTHAGVKVPARSRMLLVARSQRLRDAVASEKRTPSAKTREDVVKATERFALVVDAVVQGTGLRDARDAGKALSEVAEDLAAGSVEAQSDEQATRTRGGARMDAATTVLSAGSAQVARLGSLGADLGEIVDADLLRIARARGAHDHVHTELAARDLAARLGQPDPSFGSKSGRGGPRSGGGESGGARGDEADQGEAGDEVDEAFRQSAADLEQLAQDHAAEIGKMEQALSEAAKEEQGPAQDQTRKHAAAVREAVRVLPQVGAGSASWTSKGAAARELAEQAARALESGRLDEAAQSAGNAISALEEAKRALRSEEFDPGPSVGSRLDDSRRKLEAERAWIEDQLEHLRKRVSERARAKLAEGGDEEGKLGDRARKLAERERERGSATTEAVDSIEDAARAARRSADAFRRGDADEGMKHQREAQRDLDAANDQLGGEDSGGDEGATSKESVDIPEGSKHKGPTEFRRRVVEGLGRPADGALKEAVRRYAEGLLR